LSHGAGRITQEARFRLLVNNAGFGLLGDFAETDISAQFQMYRVHVLATMRLSHAALPCLIRADEGGIINVASVAGFVRMPGHASYASTKDWMIAFTECLHLELRSAGSRTKVQALCPGYTYTEFHNRLGIDRDKLMSLQGFWMTAGFVVAQSLAAFDRGRWLVIPGWRYRLIVSFLGMAPRALLHPIAMRVARRRVNAAR
jgi:short-subunit dehydrogenase